MTRIEEILPLLQGEFICVVNGEEKSFQCKEDFEKAGQYQNYIVSSLSVQEGNLVLVLTPWQTPTAKLDSEWAKEYQKKIGAEPSFF